MFITVFGNRWKLEKTKLSLRKSTVLPKSKGLLTKLRIKYLKLYTLKEVKEIVNGLKTV